MPDSNGASPRGVRSGVRTCAPQIKSLMLYQLSYADKLLLDNLAKLRLNFIIVILIVDLQRAERANFS